MPSAGEQADASGVAEATARRSYGKLLAFLAHRMLDVAAAGGLPAGDRPGTRSGGPRLSASP
jgi:hypothetical protein